MLFSSQFLRSFKPWLPAMVGLLVGCSRPPDRVTLSGGPEGGFYNRLAQQISISADNTVGLKVRSLDSEGSRQNLQRLRDRQADFALMQLDVAADMMRQGQIQAVAILANEHIHVITQDNWQLRSLADLNGQRIGMGSAGSGIRFTADQLMQAANLRGQADDSSFDRAFQKLAQRQLEATIYVGSTGASERLRQRFARTPQLRILPISAGVINYILTRNPGSYQAATITAGTYQANPPMPAQDIPTLSTATVLVTRPDVDGKTVGLMTWAIVSSSRKFSQFYPELQEGDAKSLLQRGLFYLHPKAQDVFDQGDPREAWLRYLENNSDLQAGLVILLGTSGLGLLLQQWRRDRSKKLLTSTFQRINELQQLLTQNPEAALEGIESLGQEHRLMFIEGAIAPDVYDQVQQKTQLFAEDCRKLLTQHRQKLVLDTLLLLDDWQATLQVDPQTAMQKLVQIKQQYREMLLAGQVDIEAYIELMELTLMSIMTLTPRRERDERH
jgi:uncharacterized protein